MVFEYISHLLNFLLVWLDTSNDDLKVPKFENLLFLKVVRIMKGAKSSARAISEPVVAEARPSKSEKGCKLEIDKKKVNVYALT